MNPAFRVFSDARILVYQIRQSRSIAKERINAAWLAGGINSATLAATWTVVSAIGAKEAGIETQLNGMTREQLIAWDVNEAWA
jgi:hypothetical protein